jgi:hypothetical protein
MQSLIGLPLERLIFCLLLTFVDVVIYWLEYIRDDDDDQTADEDEIEPEETERSVSCALDFLYRFISLVIVLDQP